MINKILKKLFTIIAIYALLFIGIFTLQFKNQKSLKVTLGSFLKASFSLSQDSLSKSQKQNIKDNFSVACGGLVISGSKQGAVAFVQNTDGSQAQRHLALLSYQKTNDLSLCLEFSDSVVLNISLDNAGDNAKVFFSASFPEGIKQVAFPYSVQAGYVKSSQEQNSILISSKNKTYQLLCDSLGQEQIVFLSPNSTATFSHYEEQKQEGFELLATLPEAKEGVYNDTIKQYSNDILNRFSAAVGANNLAAINERVIMAYISIMASQNRYNVALETVPDTFKQSTKHTYLTACYFGSIQQASNLIEGQLRNYDSLIEHSVSAKNLKAFESMHIDQYIALRTARQNVAGLLGSLASFENPPTLLEAAGILKTYCTLAQNLDPFADKMQSYLQVCLATIQQACTIQNDIFAIKEGQDQVSFDTAIKIGSSLLQYGQQVNNPIYIASGRYIIDFYFAKSTDLDPPASLSSLAELFPFLQPQNLFYPRLVVISKPQGLWAYTCANAIDVKQEKGNQTITLDFPQGDTHYLVLYGIKPFDSIYIYDVAYRSDKKFESYNSSGYIYDSAKSILYLKSRHKTQKEVIRLVHTTPAPSATASPAPSASATSIAPVSPVAPAPPAPSPATQNGL